MSQATEAPRRAASTTVVKALELLRTVGDFPHGATAAQIAERSGHPFSTAYRLLTTLTDTGFVAFTPTTKTYSLGLAVFELGQRVGHARGFTGMAAPVLERLTAATQESTVLAVLDGTRTLTVHTVDGPQFRTTTDPGDHGPLNTSAMGKALLAWQPPRRRAELLDSAELVALTPTSVVDRAALEAQLDAAVARGWAEQQEEQDAGMNAIAVPVLRPDGSLVAALALAAPIFRADLAALRGLVPQLREAADRLGSLLP